MTETNHPDSLASRILDFVAKHDGWGNALDYVEGLERRAAEPVCTCPSGDGSLRWPCPTHPPTAAPVVVGADMVERAAHAYVIAASRINGQGYIDHEAMRAALTAALAGD